MEDSDTIVVNVQLTARDLNDLWKGSRVKNLLWFLIPIGLLYAYFIFATIVNEGFTAANALSIILYSIVVLLASLAGLIVSRARAQLMIRYGPTLRELRRYTLSNHGVRFDSELMMCDCRWGAFSKILECRMSFVLYQSPLSGSVIPKRCLSTTDDVGRLRELFRNQFKGKLKLRA
jgi:hypothetical protein